MTTLSIAIISWNTRELLQRCLQAVYNTTSGLELEVFVVDNASADGSAAMVRDLFPQVRLIENDKNLGFARANNQALALSQGRYILLLNSDTEVQPAAVQLLIEVMDTHVTAGAAGPMMLNPDGTFQNSYGALPSVLAEVCGPYLFDFLSKPWGRLGRKFHKRLAFGTDFITVDRVSFACTLVRREALNQIGTLDESFLFYSEDYDWFKRLKNAGWDAVFCPQPKVKHFWGASSRQNNEWSLKQLYASKRLYFSKHHGPDAEKFLRFGLIVRFVIKLVVSLASFPIRREQATRQARLQWKLVQAMLMSTPRASTIV